MNQEQFKAWMQAAKIIGGDYQAGYCRGLRRYYHGERFDTLAEHEQWLNFSGYRQLMGDGYRDGFAGKPPKGMHGNVGNQHAAKLEKLEAAINLRVPADLKAHCVAKAHKSGLKLSAWIQKVLQKACQN